ncbi:hypothetical protein JXJ21_26295 [candidate division KSB1 bacterium]|nr:hypothetical protein [candidate division KSB1 bacterium]
MGKFQRKSGLILLLIYTMLLNANWAQSQSREFELDAIRFFEGGSESPPSAEHKTAKHFDKRTTRYVYCKVHFKNLLYKIREQCHDVTWRYYDPQDKLFGEATRPLTMKYEWDHPAIWRGFGWKEPGKFEPGTYKVHIYVDGQKIGQDQFIILDDAGASEKDRLFKEWDKTIRDSGETSSPAQSSEQMQFQLERAQTGGGGTLQTQIIANESSESLLATAFKDARRYFKNGPIAVSGFSDVSGQETQILFQANYQGNPVVGLATAVINPQTKQAQIKFIFNQQGQISSTLKNVARQAGATGGSARKNPVEALQWSWQESREGASRLKLPEGWQILDSNAQGMLYAKGPQGSVTFGLYFNIYTPTHLFATIDQRMVVAAYCDPVSAFRNVFPQAISKYLYQAAGLTAPQMEIKVIESAPMNYPPPGQAALINCEVKSTQSDGTRKHTRGLAAVITAPTGMTQWLLYYSEIASPASSFDENFPILWEIWKSWKTSSKVFQQRIDDALKSMSETNRNYQQAMQERDRVMEDTFSDWDEYIRGYRYIEDTNDDGLYQVNLHLAQPLVQKLNDDLGYQRYREVPMREFNRMY